MAGHIEFRSGVASVEDPSAWCEPETGFAVVVGGRGRCGAVGVGGDDGAWREPGHDKNVGVHAWECSTPENIWCLGSRPRAVAYNDSMDTHTAERDVVIERVADQTTTTTTGGQQ